MAELILIRGLPGSGKSTMAKAYVRRGYQHFEADMYFERGGKYAFDLRYISQAHEWCLQQTKKALAAGKNVVVSNTFVKKWELEPYLKLTPNLTILTAKGNYQNVHGVPPDVIARMKSNWEH